MKFLWENLIQNSVCQKHKAIKHRLFIPVKLYKLKLKSLRDREIAHTVYTGSLLNQELHPVFPETIGGIH